MSIAIAFPCETCDDTGDDVWKFKPAWASIAGYGTRCVHWPKEGSESLDRRWPMADPPEIGGTYALRVGHLFKGAQAEPFWVLFQPAHSAVYGWEEYPEELGASSMVKCHLLNVRANEGEQSAWLRIHVVDVMRLHELSRRVEVQEADSLPPYPMQRTVRADWEDLTYFNGNMEGDVGVWFVCQRLEERPTLLLYSCSTIAVLRGRLCYTADYYSPLDSSARALQQSQYMTNILPQAATMNRGAWYRTEKMIECYRDLDELLVLGGVLWGQNADDDYFLASHGVATPDAFWKLILRGKDRVIAWVIPNSQEATQARLDTYLVSIQELEARTGETFPEVPDYARWEKPAVSWLVPMGCDRG